MNMIFKASMDSLYQMLQFIRVEVRAAGFSGVQEMQVELALEEAIVNIIKHGYKNSAGNIDIYCTCIPYTGIQIVLIDSGIPFNPLSQINKVNLKELPADRAIGGYGVFLIVTIMNDVNYEYKEGKNYLTLVKFFDQSINNPIKKSVKSI